MENWEVGDKVIVYDEDGNYRGISEVIAIFKEKYIRIESNYLLYNLNGAQVRKYSGNLLNYSHIEKITKLREKQIKEYEEQIELIRSISNTSAYISLGHRKDLKPWEGTITRDLRTINRMISKVAKTM